MKAQKGNRGMSALCLTSALDVGGKLTPRPGRFTPENDPVTICIGGRVHPRAGLDPCGYPPPLHRDSIPGPSRPCIYFTLSQAESSVIIVGLI